MRRVPPKINSCCSHLGRRFLFEKFFVLSSFAKLSCLTAAFFCSSAALSNIFRRSCSCSSACCNQEPTEAWDYESLSSQLKIYRWQNTNLFGVRHPARPDKQLLDIIFPLDLTGRYNAYLECRCHCIIPYRSSLNLTRSISQT